jgi:ATP-binding protein involved in chromosome partitioning
MPAFTEDQIRAALRSVRYPGFSRDIVSFGLVKEVNVEGNDIHVQLSVATKDESIPEKLRTSVREALQGIDGVQRVQVHVALQNAPATPSHTHAAASAIEGVRHVIAVASGKGGVGKSTVATNLALALRDLGNEVGLCDCDMYGPSIALMMGTTERPMASADERILPVEQHGLKLMSMGFLLDDDAPAVLRGPMVTRYTQQFLRQVDWGRLDYLILDLPPGTGDIQLTIVQTVALTGAVVVTTPQEVALIDARKAASMFAKVNVPVLGIIENMSYFLCPSDGKRYDIFGAGGGEREANRLRVPLLSQIPIDIATREAGDRGFPVVVAQPKSDVATSFRTAAEKIQQAAAGRVTR